jgi:hypothetical protein
MIFQILSLLFCGLAIGSSYFENYPIIKWMCVIIGVGGVVCTTVCFVIMTIIPV